MSIVEALKVFIPIEQSDKMTVVNLQNSWIIVDALLYTVKSLKKKWENIQLRMQDQVLIGSITASDRIHPARSSRVQ